VARDRSADEAIAIRYLPRCRAIARALTAGRRWERDECESEAYFALGLAISAYDPDRVDAMPPGPYIEQIIWNRVRTYLHGRRPKGKGRGPLATGLPASLSSFGEGNGVLAREDDPAGEIEWEDWIGRLMRALPRREAEVVRCRCLHADGATHKGAAARMGITTNSAQRLYRQAVESARAALAHRKSG
jgi:DNA-directed RNA polymerase specialized sigma24 family protein